MGGALNMWVNGLVVGTWGLLLVTLLVLAVAWVWRRRWEATLPLGLFVFAMAVRMLASDRLPIVSSHTDFTQLRDIMSWFREGLDRFHGFSPPPGFRLFHWMVFKLFGPGVDVAFGTGLVVSAAIVVPVYLAARALTGSRFAGVLAGLAAAVYPAGVHFANGMGMETGTATLGAVNLALFFMWLRRGQTNPTLPLMHLPQLSPTTLAVGNPLPDSDGGNGTVSGAPSATPAGPSPRRYGWTQVESLLMALAYVASLSLFIQSRGEGIALAVFMVFFQLLMVLEAGQIRRFLRYLPMWLMGAGCLVPFVLLLMQNSKPEELGEFRGTFLGLLAVVVPAGLLLVAWVRRIQAGAKGAAPLAWGWLALVLISTAYLLYTVLDNNPLSDIWFSSGHTDPEFPFVTFYALKPTPVKGFVLSPSVFPILYLALVTLAMLPIALRRRPGVWLAPMLMWAVPNVVELLLSNRATGHVVAEGFRYLAPHHGPVAIAVGLGAYRIWLWVRPHFRIAGEAAAVLAVLGPLATHQAVMTDTTHNIQREYLFLRQAWKENPPGPLVVVPDFAVEMYGSPEEGTSVAERFRVEHLISALSALEGRRTSVRFLARDRNNLMRLRRDVYVYLGQDCYRVNAPMTQHPWCQWARETPGISPLASQTIPNRRFCGSGIERLGPRTPTLELGWYKATPEGLRRWLYRIETGNISPD